MPAHRSGAGGGLLAEGDLHRARQSLRAGSTRHQGFVALFDGVTGELRALVNAVGDHGDPHRRRLRCRDASARAARLAGARDPRRRRPGALPSRGDARRAAVRARARLEPDTGACCSSRRPRARRRRGRRRRRGGGARRRRGRHRDHRGRADRAPRVAEGRRSTSTPSARASRLDPRARHRDDGRRGALRRPSRVDRQRVGRLSVPAPRRRDRRGPHPGRGRRGADRRRGRTPRRHRAAPSSSRSASRSRTSPPPSSSWAARRPKAPVSRSTSDRARRDPPRPRGDRRRRCPHAARSPRRRRGRRDLAQARDAAAGQLVQDPRRRQRGAAGLRRGAPRRRAHRKRRQHGPGRRLRGARAWRPGDDRRPGGSTAHEARGSRALRRHDRRGSLRRMVARAR